MGRLLLMTATCVVALSGLGANASGLLDRYPAVGDIVFEPVSTPGDPKTLAKRGETCMAKILRSGRTDIPTIVTSDPDGGQVVGRSVFSVPQGLLSRGTVVFEAKEGRFRISYTQTEMYDPIVRSWIAAFRRPGKSDDYTRIATDIANSVSSCVTEAKADW